ncbi:MAG TPA: extracellular solute-binding protein [Acidobacteriaceae bacterium]|nr:extracellular solute-binding protein [Acidobacteriaceae bacterium]
MGKSRALALLFLVTFQVGCHKSPQPLTIRVAGDDWFLKSLVETGMISSYEQKTGEHIEILNRNDRTIMKDLDGDAAAEHAPYDLVVMRHRLLGALVQKHEIQPIDSLLTDPALHDPSFDPRQQLFPNWWRELSWYGDKIYGYPYTGLTAFLCYRNDLLEDPENQRKFKARYHRDLAVPNNWKEYDQVAEFFTRPADHFYGTYISGKQGLALWYEWLNFVYSFGGDILDTQHGWEYSDIVVNSPQNVAATEQYAKLIAYSPPDTLTYGWNEAQAALQQEHAFMGLLWSDQAYLLEDAKSKVAGKIGYSLVPSDGEEKASQMEGLTYLVPTGSPHPKEAYRFLEWAMSDQVQVSQTLHGSTSIRQSVYEDPKVKQLPYVPAFLASVPIAKEKPTIPEASQMTDAAERRLSEILTGKESARNGLDELALDLQQILGSKAKLRYPVHGKS